MNQIKFFRDLQQVGEVLNAKMFISLLSDWEGVIFRNPTDIPTIHTEVIESANKHPYALKRVLLENLLEYRKTCNRAGSPAWEYINLVFLESDNIEAETQTDLHPIFKDSNYCDLVLNNLVRDEYCSKTKNGYSWDKNKVDLAGLAGRLRDCKRLNDKGKIDLNDTQKLCRLFFDFFNEPYDKKNDRAFTNDRIKETHKNQFEFITSPE